MDLQVHNYIIGLPLMQSVATFPVFKADQHVGRGFPVSGKIKVRGWRGQHEVLGIQASGWLPRSGRRVINPKLPTRIFSWSPLIVFI